MLYGLSFGGPCYPLRDAFGRHPYRHTGRSYPGKQGHQPRLRGCCECHPFDALYHPHGGHHSPYADHCGIFHRDDGCHCAAHHSATPFIARIIESSLLEVDPGVIEAAESMGASPIQIIWKVLLPESMHAIVLGVTLAIISLIGSSAMAGALGGGGLGDLAIRYGYQRFQADTMAATVVILIALVQLVQSVGNYISAKLNKTKMQ